MRLTQIAGTVALAAALMSASIGLAAAKAPKATRSAPSTNAVLNAQAAAAAISRYRAQYGLGPVVIDARLSRAAAYQAGANARSGSLSHDAGGSFDSRMIAAGFGRGGIAENLGMGHQNFEHVFARWQASPAHNSNLLLPQIRRIGIAHADAPGSMYGRFWALELAR